MKKYIIPTSTVIELSAESSMLVASQAQPSVNDHKYNSGVDGAGTQFSGKHDWGHSSIWDEGE